ncbi:MAG: aspartate carbamoyltransferase catalytic subunit [Myxococcales bacterium]|nr:aspartate carbamoyltransferase catalytic subunit [Myxococcota bacterium]MDW8280478.1 aspartate carbamoyltransferase catalytic subunit [Myxococcales bacterium]
MAFPHRHLLGMADLSPQDITQILDLADTFLEISTRPIKKVPTLRGRTVINLFLEPSTRTRTSFEIAAKRLSADTINLSGSTASTVKGETLLDTARNLQAMAPDVVVLRHSASGAAHLIAAHIDAAVINAGDGMHEHPTQALLDLATIRRHKGDMARLRVGICGDIAHSRVARSDLIGLTLMGAEVHLVAPRTMMPPGIETLCRPPGRVHLHDALDEVLPLVDVMMMLRLQSERQSAGLFPNLREYSRTFGLGPARAARLRPDAIIMHPGPLHRGVEIDPAVADGPRSVILEQVTYGVAVRMALLYLLGGGTVEA